MNKINNSVQVFIDSQYLYKVILEFEKLYGVKYKLDYNQFAITLAKSLNKWLTKVYYYTAPPYQSSYPTEDEKIRLEKYVKVMNQYKKIKNFEVREGRCQKINDKYHEKGVDTLVTMDLVKTGYVEEVNTIILVACDTDYVPVINELRRKGIKVILFHYTDRVRNSKFSLSNHLENACDQCILLSKSLFEKSVYVSNK